MSNVDVAVMAYQSLERKKHQMEKAEHEMSVAAGLLDVGDMEEYMSRTERIRGQLALSCPRCRKGELESLIDQGPRLARVEGG